MFILQKEHTSTDKKWILAIPNLQIEQIRSIKVSTEFETFTLHKDKETWYVQTEKDYYADNELIRKILTIFLQEQCTHDITNSPNEYGLQSPKISFNIEKGHTITIGDPTPTHEGNYIAVSGKQCRTKTNISGRIPTTSQDYRSTDLLFSSTSMIETIALNNNVIIEKNSGNWVQRSPLSVFLSHEKIDLWLDNVSNEKVVRFIDKRPKIMENRLIIQSRNAKNQFEWSDNETMANTYHMEGFVGSKNLVQLLNIDVELFYEPMLLPNTFHNKKISFAEHTNQHGETVKVDQKNSFWRLIQEPVFARVQETNITSNEELTLYFEDDTKLTFQCARKENKLLLSSPLEDIFILAPQDFLPSE